MILKDGESVHVITRRMFESDLRRHFVGVVQAVSEVTVRIDGYLFVLDTIMNQWMRMPERRVRIIGLADSGSVIHVIPENVDIEEISFGTSKGNRTVLTDGKSFRLEINEFSPTR